MAEMRVAGEPTSQRDPLPAEIYEGQLIELVGFVWREAFPGPPNYESLKTDTKEVYWVLVLRHPLTLIAESAEDGSSYRIENIKRLQMVLMPQQYESNRGLVLRDALVTGKLRPSITGHHHTDALIEVLKIEPSVSHPLGSV